MASCNSHWHVLTLLSFPFSLPPVSRQISRDFVTKGTYYTGILPRWVNTINKIKLLKVNKNISMMICWISHRPEITWEQVLVIWRDGKTEPGGKAKPKTCRRKAEGADVWILDDWAKKRPLIWRNHRKKPRFFCSKLGLKVAAFYLLTSHCKWANLSNDTTQYGIIQLYHNNFPISCFICCSRLPIYFKVLMS